MKHKILYLAPQNPYPPIDGGKISIYYPLVYLSKYFDIHFAFICDPTKVNIEKLKNHFAEFNVKIFPFPKKDLQNDFKYLMKNLFKKEPFKWDKYYSLNFQNALHEIIKEEKIEFVLVSSPHMSKYAVELRKNFSNLKIFLREHNIEFKLVEQFKNFANNPIYKLIASWQLQKSRNTEIAYWHFFDKIFFISDMDLEIATELCPDLSNKFEVLYDGFELKVADNISYKENSFIYTANLKTIQNALSLKWFVENIWIPNINYFKHRNIKLYITGNSRDLICKIINKRNIEDLNIISLGFVEDINEEILKCKYVLSPTIIGSGLRLKVLNGMACGRPVFLTPLDLSTCKVFNDMKNVVCFSHGNDFIEKLSLLEQKSDLYYRICTNAIQTINDYFNWGKYALKLNNIMLEEENI